MIEKLNSDVEAIYFFAYPLMRTHANACETLM